MNVAVTAGHFAKLQAQKHKYKQRPDNYYDRVSDYNNRKGFKDFQFLSKYLNYPLQTVICLF